MYFFGSCLTISKAGETLGKHLSQYPPKSPDFSNFIINNLFFHFSFISLNILYFSNLAFAYPELAPACPSNISIKFLMFIKFYISISYVVVVIVIRGMWGNIWGRWRGRGSKVSKEGLQLTELRFGALLVGTEGVGETDEGGVGGRKKVTIWEGRGLGCHVGQLLG